MRITQWTKLRGATCWLNEARIREVSIRLDTAGRPVACVLDICRENDQGKTESLAIEIDASEMFMISSGIDGWEYKNREYGEKIMREARQELV